MVATYRRALAAVGFAILLSLPSAVFARPRQRNAPSILSGQFWMPIDSLAAQDIVGATDEERFMRLLAAEAGDIFSGLLYGYRWEYTPADPHRGISDRFSLAPIASIASGDPRLRVREAREERQVLYARFDYFPEQWQIDRLYAWRGALPAQSSGSGRAPYIDGIGARNIAYQRAIKEAIRSRLRVVTRNRPYAASGSLLLLEPPRLIVDNGDYIATAKTAINLDQIVPYPFY